MGEYNYVKYFQSSDSCYSWADVEDFLTAVDVDQDGKMDYAEMLRAFHFNESGWSETPNNNLCPNDVNIIRFYWRAVGMDYK